MNKIGPMTDDELSRFGLISDTMQDKDIIDTLTELAEREGELLKMEVCLADKEAREATCYRMAALCAAIGRLKILNPSLT